MTHPEQPKPDLSGEWTLNLATSRLSPVVAAAARSGVLRIDHVEPRFKCHLTIVFADKPVETNFELLSDGREVTATAGDRQIVSSLRWDGDALVGTWHVHGPDDAMTISFRYELRDSGRRLHATEELRSSGRNQDNLWVFDRS